jgi:hypothetical protein
VVLALPDREGATYLPPAWIPGSEGTAPGPPTCQSLQPEQKPLDQSIRYPPFPAQPGPQALQERVAASLLQVALIFLLGLAGNLPLAAQGPQGGPALGQGNEVGAALSLRPTLSHAAGEALSLLAIGAAIRVSPRVELGGEGVFGLNRVRVSPSGSPDHLDLTLGYGGLHLRYHAGGPAAPSGWSGGLLVGAGTGRVHSALANAEVGTENFAVLETSISHMWHIRHGIRGGISGAYRVVAALDPLPGMEEGEGLGGLSLSLVLHLLRDP